jgi:hypothetical protein|tara:strand:+ start:969 stop:1235 length:267 start_codon:yes stop_codon:yes gene_type:complete
MKCDNCKTEDQWLEMIGKNFICNRCVGKHTLFGKVQKTHIDTFRFLMRKLKPEGYSEFMSITNKEITDQANVRKLGIKVKTSNVVDLD